MYNFTKQNNVEQNKAKHVKMQQKILGKARRIEIKQNRPELAGIAWNEAMNHTKQNKVDQSCVKDTKTEHKETEWTTQNDMNLNEGNQAQLTKWIKTRQKEANETGHNQTIIPAKNPNRRGK